MIISLISSKNKSINRRIFHSNSQISVSHFDSAFIMSDEVVYNHAPKTEECVETATAVVTEPEAVEKSDRGLFDMFGKKKEEEKCEEAAISSEFDQKVHVSEPEPEKKVGFLAKLHRTSSSSSSSSDEECDENGEKKKKKKKPLKEKKEEETSVPIEKYDETPVVKTEPEEKKGFMEKIKEKLPGGHKKVEGEEHASPPPTPAVVAHDGEGEHKEKKGIFEKIKEKIPGYHSKSEEEKEKEKVKECD